MPQRKRDTRARLEVMLLAGPALLVFLAFVIFPVPVSYTHLTLPTTPYV